MEIMGYNHLSRIAATAAAVCLSTSATNSARAASIQAGINSCIAASGAATAGTIDSCYVTAVFGTNAYIEDGTGGIYLFKGANTQGFSGLATGDQINGLSGGSFFYYTTGTQFEYEPTTSTTNFADTSLTIGTIASIPASYYSTLTLATFNSATAQGSASAQGMQNQLVTIASVTISGAGGTFAASTSYTMTDASGNTGVLYVNAASGLVGATIPTGSTKVSGVFQDFKGGSELLPRAVSDVSAVPEPSTIALLGAGFLGLLFTARRFQGRKWFSPARP